MSKHKKHKFYWKGNLQWGFSLHVTPPFTKDEPDPLYWSIRKWSTITEWMALHPEARVFGRGADTCALCAAHPGCEGCPIATATGQCGCQGTPYIDFIRSGGTDKEAARAELEFLRGLRKIEVGDLKANIITASAIATQDTLPPGMYVMHFIRASVGPEGVILCGRVDGKRITFKLR